MSWTKRQIIEQAFEAIGLAAYTFDLTQDQMQSALRKLDAMMAGWDANGIRLAYPMPSAPNLSDIDADTSVPDYAIEAMYTNLAIRIAPAYGKQVPEAIHMAADQAYGNLVNQAATPVVEMQFPHTMPRGAGNKPWRYRINPFMDKPADTIQVGNDSELTYN